MKVLYLCWLENNVVQRWMFQCKLIHRWLDDKLFPEFADMKLMKELFVGWTHPGTLGRPKIFSPRDDMRNYLTTLKIFIQYDLVRGVGGWWWVAAWRCKQGKLYLDGYWRLETAWLNFWLLKNEKESWRNQKVSEKSGRKSIWTDLESSFESAAQSQQTQKMGEVFWTYLNKFFALKSIDLFVFPAPRKSR